jgi:hypothetical protein
MKSTIAPARRFRRSTLLLLLFLHFGALHAQPFRTETLAGNIRSLQVHLTDDRDAPPIIPLDGSRQIEIKFDEMSHDYRHLTCHLTHCNADWMPSDLTPIEYIHGFRQTPVDDYRFSFNTTRPYTHYRISFPNADTQFIVSGNYVALIFDADRPETPLLSACFSVIEASTIPITAQITTSTDIDFNRAHQQLSFTLDTRRHPLHSPQQQLKVRVSQNNRTDHIPTDLQPSSIAGHRYLYEHNRRLIFEAGNEYRRFEITTTAYHGMGVEALDFHDPYYHITLFRDAPRARRSYIYDEDQNGRYLVRAINADDHDAEADYFFVHFSLAVPEPFLGKVYIQSEAFNNLLDARSEMQYNWEKKTYEKTTLLKQGAYNYLYLVTEGQTPAGKTAPVEGNFFETDNEYQILVYYRPTGDRFDRLAGALNIRSRQ